MWAVRVDAGGFRGLRSRREREEERERETFVVVEVEGGAKKKYLGALVWKQYDRRAWKNKVLNVYIFEVHI